MQAEVRWDRLCNFSSFVSFFLNKNHFKTIKKFVIFPTHLLAGILFVYAVGPYVSFAALQFICMTIPLLFAVTFFFMPDTPNYYLSKNLKHEANQSLQFLRGKSSEGVKEELAIIQASVDEAQRNKGSFSDIVKNKGNLKALIICVGLISFQQLSGINVVLFNGQTIFEKTGSDLEPAIATIIVGIVQVLASGCTPLIVDRLGRKLILLVSAAGMALSLGTMGLYFYMDSINSPSVPDILWLPVASLIMFVTVYCVGFGPLPWAVLGEMFPPNVKSNASTIVASTCWTLGFFVTKYFASIGDSLGMHWAFWIFGIFCVIAFAFTYTIVMETKGLSLQQIQDRLNGRTSSDSSDDAETK